MNAELTELVFILDRSGSMGGLESDTIGGFNGMIERQKKEGEVVYIPGAANIRNENTNQTEAIALSKEDKILEYIRQNGSISSQKAADIGGYKSKTGARKLLDKMIEKGLITKIGNGPATKYVI